MNVVTELLKSSLKLKPTIISLAECPLENEDWMNLKGFTCYANTKAERWGCAVYVKDEFVNMFAVGRVSTQFISLWTAGTEITFGYQRPSNESWDPNNEWPRGSDNIIIGDLNAKHKNWSEGGNYFGQKMRRWIEERGLEVRNPFMITLPPYRQRGKGTTIDVVISGDNRPCKIDAMDIASAEHRALKIRTNLTWRKSTEDRLRYDKADWGQIRAALTLLDHNSDQPALVQKSLTRILLQHTPRARVGAKAFWNKDLEKCRIAIRTLQKKGGKDPRILNLKRAYRKKIAKAKIEANSRPLQEETDPECFRSIRPMCNKRPIPSLIRRDGSTASEHPHIASEVQEALYGGQRERNSTVIESVPDMELMLEELDAALKVSPNGAFPGPDRIPTRMVREFRKSNDKLFLATMNRALLEGIPDVWKTSDTILIPKARKESYSDAKSWRPIQLQSILAKVLERVIVTRLAKLDLLEANMFGGRKKSGTTDAIQALDDFVQSHHGYNICLSALDIEGGFDHLNLGMVCDRIKTRSPHLAEWVRHWGHGRKTSYRFNGRTSQAFHTSVGTPQGSPLSPILFLISTKDILSTSHGNQGGTEGAVLAYIDNMLVATVYKNKDDGQVAHQGTIDEMTLRAKLWGYSFSANKGEYIHIHMKKQMALSPMIGDSLLHPQEYLRWLGFFISPDWKWKRHLQEWCTKATHSGYGIRAMTERYQISGLNAWCTHRLIKGLVLPQLSYGIELWNTKGLIQEAQKTLHKIVRNSFGLEVKTPVLAIDAEIGIPLMDLYALQRHNMLALRAITLDRPTRMAQQWLTNSGIPDVITNAFGLKEGYASIKENIRYLWGERIESSDIRYEGKHRAKYGHLRKLTRHQLREVIGLRATSGWPYQSVDGTRRQCICDRDIITPHHLMNFCGKVDATKLSLHSNKTIGDLTEWMGSWPPELRNTTTAKTEDRAGYIEQVAGAAINLPTSQPSQRKTSTPAKNIRKHEPCTICGKSVQANSVAREKHARTHLPGYGKRKRGGRK